MTVSTQGDPAEQGRAEIVSKIKDAILGGGGLDTLPDEVRNCDAGRFARTCVEIYPAPGDDDRKKILGWVGRLEEGDGNSHLRLQIAAEYARVGSDMAVSVLGSLCVAVRKKGKAVPAKSFLKMFRDVMMTKETGGLLFSLFLPKGSHADAIAACAVAASALKTKKVESGSSGELAEKLLRWYTAQDTPPKLPYRLEEEFIEAIKGIDSPEALQVPPKRLGLMPPAIVAVMRERGIVAPGVASQGGDAGPARGSPIQEQNVSEPNASPSGAPSTSPVSSGFEAGGRAVPSEPPKAFDPYDALREVDLHFRKFEREARQRGATLEAELKRLHHETRLRDAEHRDLIAKYDAMSRNNERLSLAIEEKAQTLAEKEARLRNLEDALSRTLREKETLDASLNGERAQHKRVVESLNEMVTRESETKLSELKARLASMLRVEYNQLKDLEIDGPASEREEVLAKILRQMFQRLKATGIDPSGGSNG